MAHKNQKPFERWTIDDYKASCEHEQQEYILWREEARQQDRRDYNLFRKAERKAEKHKSKLSKGTLWGQKQ